MRRFSLTEKIKHPKYLDCIEYYNTKGKLHRDGDKPAIECKNGFLAWYKNGILTRESDKPTSINTIDFHKNKHHFENKEYKKTFKGHNYIDYSRENKNHKVYDDGNRIKIFIPFQDTLIVKRVSFTDNNIRQLEQVEVTNFKTRKFKIYLYNHKKSDGYDDFYDDFGEELDMSRFNFVQEKDLTEEELEKYMKDIYDTLNVDDGGVYDKLSGDNK